MVKEINGKELERLVGVFLTDQSLIHQIDSLHDDTAMKTDSHRVTKRASKYWEKQLNALGVNMDKDEGQLYIDSVCKIDNLVKSLVSVS